MFCIYMFCFYNVQHLHRHFNWRNTHTFCDGHHRVNEEYKHLHFLYNLLAIKLKQPDKEQVHAPRPPSFLFPYQPEIAE